MTSVETINNIYFYNTYTTHIILAFTCYIFHKKIIKTYNFITIVVTHVTCTVNKCCTIAVMAARWYAQLQVQIITSLYIPQTATNHFSATRGNYQTNDHFDSLPIIWPNISERKYIALSPTVYLRVSLRYTFSRPTVCAVSARTFFVAFLVHN